MARKLSIDEITEALHEMDADIRASLVADILGDLDDFRKAGPQDGDADTWDDGYTAAMEVITANYGRRS